MLLMLWWHFVFQVLSINNLLHVVLSLLRFKYTTKFSLPKIACPAIVYAEMVVVIDLFFVGVCPWIKVYRYNPTEICQQRLQGVRNVAQKLCSWERSFIQWKCVQIIHILNAWAMKCYNNICTCMIQCFETGEWIVPSLNKRKGLSFSQ